MENYIFFYISINIYAQTLICKKKGHISSWKNYYIIKNSSTTYSRLLYWNFAVMYNCVQTTTSMSSEYRVCTYF